MEKGYKNSLNKRVYYDLLKPEHSYIQKFIQPPIPIYLVTTIDKKGNINVTPVSMGTYLGGKTGKDYCKHFYSFTLQFRNNSDPCYGAGIRDAVYNLDEVPECVISYCSTNLVDQTYITGLPLPKGISEMEVADLTSFPSRKVKPPGIAECPVNMEATVISSQILHSELGPLWKVYMCEIESVHIDTELSKKGGKFHTGAGLMDADPLFEIHYSKGKTGTLRLNYAKLDRSRIYREPEDIGHTRHWVGTFETWMEDEERIRGKITGQEREEILKLKEKWMKNPDPKSNSQVKNKLTKKIKNIVWDRK